MTARRTAAAVAITGWTPDAGRACELTDWNHLEALDAFAAAAAEVGDFEAAAGAANKALGVDVKGTRAEKKRVRERLKLYQAGKPLRIDPGKRGGW